MLSLTGWLTRSLADIFNDLLELVQLVRRYKEIHAFVIHLPAEVIKFSFFGLRRSEAVTVLFTAQIARKKPVSWHST